MVVSGLPAPAGVGGVLVRQWDRNAAASARCARVRRPGRRRRARLWRTAAGEVARAGSAARPRPSQPAARPVSRCGSVGVDVDLAPVLDLPDGPLGARQSRRRSSASRLRAASPPTGTGACVKHFPGLGTLRVLDGRAAVRRRARTRGGPRAVPRRDRGGGAVRDGRPRRVSVARRASRGGSGLHVQAAARPRLHRRRDHRLAQRRPRPRRLVGGGRCARRRRPAAVHELRRCAAGDRGAAPACAAR